MKNLPRAFRHHNFRLFFAGQGLSLIGTWIQQTALSWLVYRLTGSTLLLGITAFAGQIPILLLAPLAGSLTDRFPKERLLLWSQIFAMLQAFCVTWLAFSHAVQPWQLVTMAVFLGICTAFEIPARQALMSRLVDDKQDLPSAIAMNSFAVNSARLIGPALAGILILLLGETLCFLLNGFSYLAVIVALLAMRLPPEENKEKAKRGGIADGLAYVSREPAIRVLLVLLATTSFLATPYVTLLPTYARDVFHGDAQMLGMLMGCSGLGAILGNIFLASRAPGQKLSHIAVSASMIAGVALMGFAFSTSLWVSMLLLTAIGFGIVVTAVSTNITLQTNVDGKFRGRVMSLYTAAYLGISPLGSLVEGWIANGIGVHMTLFFAGLTCVVGAFMLATQLSLIKFQSRDMHTTNALTAIP
jgi:MFS family permease